MDEIIASECDEDLNGKKNLDHQRAAARTGARKQSKNEQNMKTEDVRAHDSKKILVVDDIGLCRRVRFRFRGRRLCFFLILKELVLLAHIHQSKVLTDSRSQYIFSSLP